MRLFRLSGSFTAVKLILITAAAAPAAGEDLIGNTLQTGEKLLSSEPLTVIGAGGAAAFGVYLLENSEGYSGFLPECPFSAIDRADDFLFGPALPISSAGIWLAGLATGEQSLEGTGEELCRGLLYTYGITAALKYSTGRTRPDGSDGLSFPSAHSAGASCAAAVIWTQYGRSAGIPAAAVALYTCLSRVNMGKHFPSDVVMGAAIGTACGLAASLDDDGDNDEGGQNRFSLGISIDSEGRISSSLW